MSDSLFRDLDLVRQSQANEMHFRRVCTRVAVAVDELFDTYVRNAQKVKLERLYEIAVTARLYNLPFGRVIAMHADVARTSRSQQEAKTALGCTLERLTDPLVVAAVRRQLSTRPITVTAVASQAGNSGIELADQLAAHPQYKVDPVRAYEACVLES